jgi:hypothetical protein
MIIAHQTPKTFGLYKKLLALTIGAPSVAQLTDQAIFEDNSKTAVVTIINATKTKTREISGILILYVFSEITDKARAKASIIASVAEMKSFRFNDDGKIPSNENLTTQKTKMTNPHKKNKAIIHFAG